MPADDQPPRHVEPVDPVPGGRLDRRATAIQPATPTTVPTTAATAPTTAPLATITSRRCRSVAPIGGEHAELAQPPLGDDHEPGRGDQRDQQQDHGGQDEHADGGRSSARSGTSRTAARHGDVARLEPAAVASGSAARRSRLVDEQHRHRLGEPARRGGTRANSSSRSLGFSTSPTTARSAPSSVERVADADPEGRRHRVGDRDLAGGGRVAALRAGPASARRRGRRVLGPESTARPSRAPAPTGGRSPRRCRTRPRPRRRRRRSVSRIGARRPSRRWSAVPNSGVGSTGPGCRRPRRRTIAAATATVSSASTSTCWRHSRRNSRHAQRTTARRARAAACRPARSRPPAIRSEERLGTAGGRSGRPRARRAGTPPGRPTRPAARRGSRRPRPRPACRRRAAAASPPRR